MSLASPVGQVDWAAGMVRVAPHLIPPNGAYRLQDMLLDDDGSAYRRGGTAYKSNAAFGTGGLRLLWDGWLAGGQRTVFANSADFGVLGVDDATPVNVGGPGLSGPVRPVSIDGLLFVESSAYGGSRKTSSYSTGTVAVTADGTTVVGTGTAWAANVDAGMVLTIGSRLVAVKSVTDDTHLELFRAWPGATASGLAYTADPVAAVPAAYNPGGSWVAAGNRLLSLKADRIAMSAQFDSTSWTASDEWLMPEGVQLLGGAAVRDNVFIFTTGGVWLLSNLDFDLTDDAGNTQQSLHQLNGDVILLNEAGIATWQNALVVPAIDGVWLLDAGTSAPVSRSITPLYADYVAKGYRPGQATVHRSHYFLPILDGGGTPVDLLVCRLDRPVRVPRLGDVFPWTNWKGAGGTVAALTVRVQAGAQRSPVLLGADRTTNSRVISFPPFKADGPRVDHDGSVIPWEVITRDYPAGQLGTVKKMRLRYELVAVSDVAAVSASYATERRPAGGLTWGSFTWGSGVTWQEEEAQGWTALTGSAPESFGDTPMVWRVGKRVRYVRFRLQGTAACDRFVLRELETFVRPSGRL